MTEQLQEAIEKANRSEDIAYDDSLLVDWLDDKAERLNKIKEQLVKTPEELHIGKFDINKGKYETEIETCYFDDPRKYRECHIYSGIEKLAAAVNKPLAVRTHLDEKDNCFYFNYKGIEFFELCDFGKELR